MRKTSRGLAAGTGLTIALLGFAPATPGWTDEGSPPAPVERLVLHDVHTDSVDVQYVDGELVLQTRVGNPPYEFYDPAEVIFQVKDVDAAKFPVPDGPDWAFLGGAGTVVWVAPQVQDFSLLFAGWDTEGLPAGVFQGDTVDLSLVDASGPGGVEVFQSGSFGEPIRVFSSSDPAYTTRTEAVHTHVHANWAFTTPGRYTLTFQASAVDLAGNTIVSEPRDYTWVVGDVVPEGTATSLTVSPPDSALVGQDVALTGTVEPAGANGYVEFFDGAASLGHARVVGGIASLSTNALAAGDHQLSAAFSPVYSNDFAASSSPAVPYAVAGGAGGGEWPPQVSLSIEGIAAEYAVGEQVMLTAAQQPQTTLDQYEWLRLSPGESEFRPIDGAGSGPSYSFSAAHDLDGAKYRVRLYGAPPGGNPEVVATSADVTLSVGEGGGEPPDCAGLDAVLNDGHVDLAARLVDGALSTEVKDGTRGPDAVVWRDLDTVAFHVRPAARTQVPDIPSYAFLGQPGTDIWQIPQTQQAGILWLGWNTESVEYTQLAGPVTWSLDKVEGPGKLAVYEFDPFGGPLVVFDGGKTLPQSVPLGEPTHAHGNWAFTAEGIYKLTFTHTATTASGQNLSSSGTIRVAVGNVDLQQLCPGGQVPDPNNPGGGDPDPDDPPAPPGTGTPQPVSSSPSKTTPHCVRPSAPASTPAGSTATSVVLADGHVDYAVRVVDGTLQSQVKDGTTAGTVEWRSPSGVVLHLVPAASTEVPSGGNFSFLGQPGAKIWQIPQTQKPGVLWLGWNTEEVSTSQVTGGIEWRLDKVDGPGSVAIYEFDAFGQPKVLLNSGDGVPDSYTIPLGTHAHGNWAFTAQGAYKLTFTHSATLASGARVSDTQTLAVAVGDTDPAGLATAGSGSPAPAATTTASGGCGPLAFTGASDIVAQAMVGGGLTAVGAALLAVGLRRRRGDVDAGAAL